MENVGLGGIGHFKPMNINLCLKAFWVVTTENGGAIDRKRTKNKDGAK